MSCKLAENLLGPTRCINKIIVLGCSLQRRLFRLIVIIFRLLCFQFWKIPPDLPTSLLRFEEFGRFGRPVLTYALLIRRVICLFVNLVDGVVIGRRASPTDKGTPVNADMMDIVFERVPLARLGWFIIQQKRIQVGTVVDIAVLARVPLERGFVLRGLCVLVRLGHTTGVLYIHVGLQVKFFWHYVLANILKRKLEAGLGAVAWTGLAQV